MPKIRVKFQVRIRLINNFVLRPKLSGCRTKFFLLGARPTTPDPGSAAVVKRKNSPPAPRIPHPQPRISGTDIGGPRFQVRPWANWGEAERLQRRKAVFSKTNQNAKGRPLVDASSEKTEAETETETTKKRKKIGAKRKDAYLGQPVHQPAHAIANQQQTAENPKYIVPLQSHMNFNTRSAARRTRHKMQFASCVNSGTGVK